METIDQIYEKFVDEYTSEDAVRKYTTGTAGYGITYLLRKDYASIYLNVVDSYLRSSAVRPLCLLEFGCGGGMNITRLLSLLEQKEVRVESAYGTDFSPLLVQAAEREARAFLSPHLAGKLSFHVARNESAASRSKLGTRQARRGPGRRLRPDPGRQYLPLLPSPEKRKWTVPQTSIACCGLEGYASSST